MAQAAAIHDAAAVHDAAANHNAAVAAAHTAAVGTAAELLWATLQSVELALAQSSSFEQLNHHTSEYVRELRKGMCEAQSPSFF